MEKKIDTLRALMAANEWRKAVAFAAQFPRLGAHKSAITAAHGAYTNPRFFLQLGKDLDALKVQGRAALINRYGVDS
jgi:hypothetical protein